MKNTLNYKDYLNLSSLLSSQSPKSLETKTPVHDEWLFVIVHQVYELWFKQIFLELDSTIKIFYQNPIHQKDLALALSRFRRVTEIQKLLLDQLDVLETMSSLDFLDFRSLLYPASGMQSFQFRLIENQLGLKSEERLKIDQNSYLKTFSEEEQKVLKEAEEVNLFYGVEKWLERMPFLLSKNFDFKIEYLKRVDQIFEKDKEKTKQNPSLSEKSKEKNLKMLKSLREDLAKILDKESYEKLRGEGKWRLSHSAIQAALMIQVYKDYHMVFYLPSLLISSLLEMEKNLTLWKTKHLLMVTKMIGSRPGTGGSSGKDYLRQNSKRNTIFSDFLSLTPFFIPRSFLPPLPSKWVEEHFEKDWN